MSEQGRAQHLIPTTRLQKCPIWKPQSRMTFKGAPSLSDQGPTSGLLGNAAQNTGELHLRLNTSMRPKVSWQYFPALPSSRLLHLHTSPLPHLTSTNPSTSGVVCCTLAAGTEWRRCANIARAGACVGPTPVGVHHVRCFSKNYHNAMKVKGLAWLRWYPVFSSVH